MCQKFPRWLASIHRRVMKNAFDNTSVFLVFKTYLYRCEEVTINNPTYTCAVYPDPSAIYPDCCPRAIECRDDKK